jgi:hypothetical protein
MGNRPPLSDPPVPTSTKVVWNISTKNRCWGTKLYVLNRSNQQQQQQQQQRGEEEEEEDQEGGCSSRNNDNGADDSICLPFDEGVFRQSSSSSSEDAVRTIESFHELLQEWNGGVARFVLLLWAALVVLGFLSAYMVPNFWSSALFGEPWFLLGFVIVQMLILATLLHWSRTSTNLLIEKTKKIFKPWRRSYNIHTTFKQVAGLRVEGIVRYTGTYCFVVVFEKINESQLVDIELASIGTTTDSIEDDDDEDNDGAVQSIPS